MAKINMNDASNLPHIDLVFLDVDQIKLIDRALSDIGDFGEVRLVKMKGKLRFIQKVKSEDVDNRR
jgi:hypothetical protein